MASRIGRAIKRLIPGSTSGNSAAKGAFRKKFSEDTTAVRPSPKRNPREFPEDTPEWKARQKQIDTKKLQNVGARVRTGKIKSRG